MTYQFVECVKELTVTPVTVTKSLSEVKDDFNQIRNHAYKSSDYKYDTKIFNLVRNLEQDIWNALVDLHNYETTNHSFYLQHVINYIGNAKANLKNIEVFHAH